jgi:hypothetical protein
MGVSSGAKHCSYSNGFNERFGLIADKDLLLRAAARRFETATTRQVIYEYGCHEGSLTMNISRPRSPSPRNPGCESRLRHRHRRHSGRPTGVACLVGRLQHPGDLRYGRWRQAGAVVSEAFAKDKLWAVRFSDGGAARHGIA